MRHKSISRFAPAALLLVATLAVANPFRPAVAQQQSPQAYVELRAAADSLARHGEASEAAQAYRRLLEANPNDDRLWTAYAGYAWRAGEREEAAGALERVVELGTDQRSRVMVRIAGMYAELGETERAYAWLERALEDRVETRPNIAGMRQFEPYADDPRFRELAGTIDAGEERVAGWRADLAWLVSEVKRLHADPRRAAHGPAFDAATLDLAARIPELDDEAITLELQRLVVLLGDGHSGVWSRPTPRALFASLPIDFYWFSDGIFVTGGVGSAAGRVGQQLVSIGGLPAATLLERTEPFISRDNPMGIRAGAPRLLNRMAVLRELGASYGLDSADVELRVADGTTGTVTLHAGARREGWRLRPPSGTAPPGPRWLQSDTNLRMEEIGPGIVYVLYSGVANPEGSTVAAFADSLYRELTERNATAVVVDVRRNGGGNNFLNWPLVRTLIRFEADEPGRKIYMLVGRHTFSAAQNFSNWVNRLTDAVFVGEPTGSAANFTGETTRVNLPYSGLTVSVSSRYWQDSHATDTRIWIAPDLPVPLDSRSYFGNRDPVIEATLWLIERERTAS